ncbi:MAG: hypothetical protein WAS07_03170 [Micropruina sp.]
MLRLYARPSPKLARQIVGDLFIVAWTALWWIAGRLADAVIRTLGDPSRETANAARSLRDSFVDAARNVEGVPFAGGALRQPFLAAADGLRGIIAAAEDQVVGIDNTATLVGWLTFALPVMLLLALWLPGRVRWVRESAAARAFVQAGTHLELLAVRALATQPISALARISPDPAGAWRRHDDDVIERLAELELARLGLKPPTRRV